MIWEYEIHFLIYLYAAWACWFPAVEGAESDEWQAVFVALAWPLWPIAAVGFIAAQKCRAAWRWFNRIGQ